MKRPVHGMLRDEAIDYFRLVLDRLGFDLDDPHLEDTPRRWIDALIEMTSPDHFNMTTFETNVVSGGETGDTGIVIVNNIPFTSLCAHHLAPFVGTGCIAYIPNGRLVGLSKLARMLSYFSTQPQIQERLGQEVADYLCEMIDPIGVAVILKARHGCMENRGAKAHGAETITSCLRGSFYHDPSARSELFTLLKV